MFHVTLDSVPKVSPTDELSRSTTKPTQWFQCAPNKDSNQPGCPPRLIRVSAVRMKNPWVLSYPLRAQRRLWWDSGWGWSESSLGAQVILFVLSCYGSSVSGGDANESLKPMIGTDVQVARASIVVKEKKVTAVSKIMTKDLRNSGIDFRILSESVGFPTLKVVDDISSWVAGELSVIHVLRVKPWENMSWKIMTHNLLTWLNCSAAIV